MYRPRTWCHLSRHTSGDWLGTLGHWLLGGGGLLYYGGPGFTRRHLGRRRNLDDVVISITIFIVGSLRCVFLRTCLLDNNETLTLQLRTASAADALFLGLTSLAIMVLVNTRIALW
jgi:hypothetical protein